LSKTDQTSQLILAVFLARIRIDFPKLLYYFCYHGLLTKSYFAKGQEEGK
jgi:hypothetical protein